MYEKENFKSDIIIGLEIHVELNTKTKLFCSCPTNGSQEPNTRTCPVCLGHPGSKPVVNKKAIEYAIRLCLALHSKIAPEMIFSRKSYFYPDMSKNYQITQYEEPLGTGGKLILSDNKEVKLVRIHVEEDPASLVHKGSMQNASSVLVDYNRSGNPLAEIVTQPDMESPAQARDFMKQLISVLNYLGIFDVNNGIIKADANVSIKDKNYVRTEIKNVTGFKEIERALKYEIARHKNTDNIVQETRGWDSEKGITFSMRTKESEDDYGYIIDPDLVAIDISDEWIDEIKTTMPEFASQKTKRFVKTFNIDEKDAKVICQNKDLADMFELCANKVDPNLSVTWCRRELTRVLNYNKMEFSDSNMKKEQFLELLKLIDEKKITENVGQEILNKLVVDPFDPKKYVEENKLDAVSDTDALEKICKEAIDENQSAVDDFKNGNEKSLNFIVGQVMRKTRGTAQPGEVINILKNLIR